MPGAVLGTGDIADNKPEKKNPALMESTSMGEMQAVNKTGIKI